MRLRNVIGAKEIIEQNDYVIKEYTKNYFNNNNLIYLEIGMGKGKFIIENALKYPDINFIGVEKYDSVIVRALEKLTNLNIPNLKLMRLDALKIDQVFDKQIDLIYLNFSDPWPKVGHANRRLTSKIFLEKYKNVFKSENHIIMKTDNRKLFEYSIISFVENNFKINEISLDLHKDECLNNVETEYENKFKAQGPIYKIDVTKD